MESQGVVVANILEMWHNIKPFSNATGRLARRSTQQA